MVVVASHNLFFLMTRIQATGVLMSKTYMAALVVIPRIWKMG